MRYLGFCQKPLCILAGSAAVSIAMLAAQSPSAIHNREGLRLQVDPDNTAPTLQIVLPGHPKTDRAIDVVFPEHVTARKAGDSEAEHLYLFQPGHEGKPPEWRQIGQSLQYERDFKGDIHLIARATLEDDGVLFHYEFFNRVQHDFRHDLGPYRSTAHLNFSRCSARADLRADKTGFDLLASETANRLTMPLSEWLPARYLASFTWPVPTQRIEHRADGITYYNRSQPVDEPMVATLSTDRKWVVSSFTRTTGNVWSNPELTCQHVDPQTSLAPGQRAASIVAGVAKTGPR